MLRWYAATLDGLDDGFPFICAEPGCCYAGICDVEDGYGEGLELGCWGDGEVDHLNVKVSRQGPQNGEVVYIPVDL